MSKKSDIVTPRLKRILAWEKEFDSIVGDLKKTPMRKAEYDEIESDLRDCVENMKAVVEQL